MALVSLLLGGVVVAAPGASASDPIFTVNDVVNAKTTLAKLGQQVTVPPGTFTGTVDLITGQLTGDLVLPPAQTTLSLAGIGLVTAGFEIVPLGPVTGHVDLSTSFVTTTSTFNVRIPYVYPLGLPINLVGPNCVTSTPITLTIKGKANLFGTSNFKGKFTIPPLKDCQLATLALNLVIPGPGNKFSAAFSPAH
jgi:hypothetical protein